jgi:hypothetical protein
MASIHITVEVTDGMPILIVCNLYGYLCRAAKQNVPPFRWDILVFKAFETTTSAE